MDALTERRCQFSIIPLMDMVAVLHIVGQELSDRPDVAHAAEARAKELSEVIDGIMDIWDDIHNLESFPADHTNRHLTAGQRQAVMAFLTPDATRPSSTETEQKLCLEIPALLSVHSSQQDVPEINWVKSS